MCKGWVESKIKAPLPVPASFSLRRVWYYNTSPPESGPGSLQQMSQVDCDNPGTRTFIWSVHKGPENFCSDSICETISAYSFFPEWFSSEQDFAEGPEQLLAPAPTSPELGSLWEVTPNAWCCLAGHWGWTEGRRQRVTSSTGQGHQDVNVSPT